jgi:hypothetical protein
MNCRLIFGGSSPKPKEARVETLYTEVPRRQGFSEIGQEDTSNISP